MQAREQFLAIGCHLEAAAIGNLLHFLLLVLDVEDLDLAALAEDQLVLLVDSHATDTGGSKRQLNDARFKVVEVDRHRLLHLRLLLVLLGICSGTRSGEGVFHLAILALCGCIASDGVAFDGRLKRIDLVLFR